MIWICNIFFCIIASNILNSSWNDAYLCVAKEKKRWINGQVQIQSFFSINFIVIMTWSNYSISLSLYFGCLYLSACLGSLGPTHIHTNNVCVNHLLIFIFQIPWPRLKVESHRRKFYNNRLFVYNFLTRLYG